MGLGEEGNKRGKEKEGIKRCEEEMKRRRRWKRG